MIVLGEEARGLRDGQAKAVLPILLLVTLMGTGSAMLTTIVSLALSRPGVAQSAVQAVLTAYPAAFSPGACWPGPSVTARPRKELLS